MDLKTDTDPHGENYDKLVKVKLRDLEKDTRQEGNSFKPRDKSESGSALIAELNSLSAEIGGQVTGWTLIRVRHELQIRIGLSELRCIIFFAKISSKKQASSKLLGTQM